MQNQHTTFHDPAAKDFAGQAKWQFPDRESQQAAARRSNYASILGMSRRVMAMGGLDGLDADTLAAIIACQSSKQQLPHARFKASNYVVGQKLCASSKQRDSIERTAQRRKRRLFQKGQPAAGVEFVRQIKGAYDPARGVSAPSAYVDFLTPAADTAIQRYWEAARQLEQSGEWATTLEIDDERDRKAVQTALRSEVFDHCAREALASLPQIGKPDQGGKDEDRTLSLADYLGDRERQFLASLQKAADKIAVAYGEPESAEEFLRRISRLAGDLANSTYKTRVRLERGDITPPPEPTAPQAQEPEPDQESALSASAGGGGVIKQGDTEHLFAALEAAFGDVAGGGILSGMSPYPTAQTEESAGVVVAPENPPDEGACAVELFASVGAMPAQVIVIDDSKPKKDQAVKVFKVTTPSGFPPNYTQAKDQADARGYSVAVRVAGPVVQVDDCDYHVAQLLRPFAFALILTSPGSYQAWLAAKDEADATTIKARLFPALRELLPGTKANGGAGGAVRWPGTANRKPCHRTPSGKYPVVEIEHAAPGRFVMPAELDAAGLLAPEPEALPPAQAISTDARGWPRYEDCLINPPLKTDGSGEPDMSRVDARWAYWSFLAGRTREEIAAQLLTVSAHAREGERQPLAYARKTADSVGTYLEARGHKLAAEERAQ
jgi:hypothetical protein